MFSAVARPFRQAMVAVGACFGPSDLRRGLRFTIDARGHAGDGRDARGTRFLEPIATCIEHALAGVKFDPPRGGPVDIVVPDLPEPIGALGDELVPLE